MTKTLRASLAGLTLFGVLAVLVPTSAAAQVPTGRDSLRRDTAAAQADTGAMLGPTAAAVDQVRQAYVDAYNRKDAAAVAALYARDGILINANGQMLRGRDSIETAFRSMASEWPRIDAQALTTAGESGLAWQVGTSSGEMSMNGRPMRESSRYLVVLGNEEGAMKIKALMVVEDSAANAAHAGDTTGGRIQPQ